MTQEYVQPTNYISRGDYKHIKVSIEPQISDLERAIVGYVATSSVKKKGIEYNHTASWPQLRELIFEYLKAYQQDMVRDFIKGNIERLGRLDIKDWLPRYKNEVKRLKSLFESLETRDTPQIEYEEFEPKELTNVAIDSGTTEFRQYCNRTINMLVEKGVIVKRPDLGRYVSLHPSVRIRCKV